MNTFARVWKRQGGFTLIELEVALLMSSITLTALLSFFSFQTSSMRVEHAHRAAQVTARGALNFIVRNLEQVGRSPNSAFTTAAPAIQAAQANSLHYLANLSQTWTDTDTTDAWENVTFSYNDEAIWVTQGGNAPVALTDAGNNPKSYVPGGGLVFTYFDKNGYVVASGGNAAVRASIRRMSGSSSIRGVSPDGHDPEVTLSQDVFLRNVS